MPFQILKRRRKMLVLKIVIKKNGFSGTAEWDEMGGKFRN